MRTLTLVLLALALTIPATAQHNQGAVVARFDVRTPMRDGVELSADLWRPPASGRYPAILLRTPYTKSANFIGAPQLGEFFARHGYVLIVQDVRGRGDSDGEFRELPQEGPDGYDSIEWIAKQSWSNGRVGMMGVSYLGVAQWLALKHRPPHLECIAPTAAPGFPFEDEPYRGGAFLMQLLAWAHGVQGRSAQRNADQLDWNWIFKQRPLAKLDEISGRRIPIYQEWLAHPTLDDYWRQTYMTPEDFEKVDIPTLTVTGWFDDAQPGAFYSWRGVATRAPRNEQHQLIVGPWDHIQTFTGGATSIAGIKVSEDSILDMRQEHLAFFDRCLKGESSAASTPRVRVYITGENRWRTFDAYPPAASTPERLYLHSAGKANTAKGDGKLLSTAPGKQPADRYRYDPNDPAPAYAPPSEEEQASNDAERAGRQDVLVYETEPLKTPLTVLGQPLLILYAASDARDTDFIARVLDVAPDGKIIRPYAGDGVIRARYLEGYESAKLLTPDRIERYTLKFSDLGHQFAAGHRIRLELTSSSFPEIAPNSNTGNDIATDTQTRVAGQTVEHTRGRASYLELPVLNVR